MAVVLALGRGVDAAVAPSPIVGASAAEAEAIANLCTGSDPAHGSVSHVRTTHDTWGSPVVASMNSSPTASKPFAR